MQDYTPSINVNSRIPRALDERKKNLVKTTENILGGTQMGQFSNNNGGNEFDTKFSTGYQIQRNRTNFTNTQTTDNSNSQGGAFGTDFKPKNINNVDVFVNDTNLGYNPPNRQGRTPLLPESQIDKHTENLTKEIQGLDQKLNSQQQIGPEVYIPRVRARGQENEKQQIPRNSFGQSNTQNSTNTSSLNNTFGKSNMEFLDVFQQKENQLKEQLKNIEKQREVKDKELQENGKKPQQSNVNSNQDNLKLKLNAPNYSINNNKPQQQQYQQQQPQNKIVSTKPNFSVSQKKEQIKAKDDEFEESLDYIPGANMTRGANNGGRDLNNTRGFNKPPAPKPKNNDEEIAVAVGISDVPFDESQDQQEQLFVCPEGCGRQFNQIALQKHIPVCKKVFQQKSNSKNSNIQQNKTKTTQNTNQKQNTQAKKPDPKNKTGTSLADIKNKMKQQKEKQGGNIKDELIPEGANQKKK